MSRYLKVPDVAALLGYAPATVYRLIRQGTIPAIQIGRRTVRVPREALEDHLANRRRDLPETAA